MKVHELIGATMVIGGMIAFVELTTGVVSKTIKGVVLAKALRSLSNPVLNVENVATLIDVMNQRICDLEDKVKES